MEINFDTFKPRSNTRVNKLSLDKGEQVRVCFIEQSPRLVYVHSFEKVLLGDDGLPIQIQETWPDGSPNIKNKTEYAGKLRCLGDAEEIQRSGADPENCPACRGHIQLPNAIKAPTARVLGNVLKYKTKPGSFAPSKPFGAELVVWDLTAKRFEQLQAIYLEHGNLAEKDLLLGPCDNKQMQKFDIAVGSGTANYLEEDSHKAYVVELLAEGRIDDLESVAGKLPSEFEMTTKVNEVIRAYNHAFNTGASSNYSSLLASDNVETVAAKADVPEAVVNAVTHVHETNNATAPEAPVSDPVQETPEVKEENKTASLDELLKAFTG